LELFLIGTSHADPQGKERLDSILENLHPEVLSIEAKKGTIERVNRSRFLKRKWLESIYRRKQYPEHLVRHGLAFFDESNKDWGYEIVSAQEFSERKKIPIYFIDDMQDYPEGRKIRARRLKKWRQEELDLPSDPEDIELRPYSIVEEIERERADYQRVRRILMRKDDKAYESEILRYFGQSAAAALGQRDLLMADHLREITQKHHSSRIAHIGGVAHILDHPKKKTLYSVIKDLRPSRIIIDSPIRLTEKERHF